MPLTTATRATAEELLCNFCTDLGTGSAAAHGLDDTKALRKAAESLAEQRWWMMEFRFAQSAIDAKTSNQAMQRTAGRSAFSLAMTSTFNPQLHAPAPAVAHLISR